MFANDKRRLGETAMRRYQLTRASVALTFALALAAGTATADEEIEKLRQEQIEKWGTDKLVQPTQVEATAKELLQRPLGQQSVQELEGLAKQANAAANFVSFILTEYQDYYRDNYKYDFVQKKVAPHHDSYVQFTNRFKDYRNQAYFNLGKKATAAGEHLKAFFYFRDAFRLSSFTDDRGDHKGMRYQAEIEMKRLLGVEDLSTFVYWK